MPSIFAFFELLVRYNDAQGWYLLRCLRGQCGRSDKELQAWERDEYRPAGVSNCVGCRLKGRAYLVYDTLPLLRWVVDVELGIIWIETKNVEVLNLDNLVLLLCVHRVWLFINILNVVLLK